MKKFIIIDLVSKNYLQNVNVDTSEQSLTTLENGSILVEDIENSTHFDWREQALDMVSEAVGRTTFEDCYFSILEVYINRT